MFGKDFKLLPAIKIKVILKQIPWSKVRMNIKDVKLEHVNEGEQFSIIERLHIST